MKETFPVPASLPPRATIDPEALTIADAVAFSGFSRNRIYALAADGLIAPRRAGRRTMILTAELRAVIANLPPAPIRRKVV